MQKQQSGSTGDCPVKSENGNYANDFHENVSGKVRRTRQQPLPSVALDPLEGGGGARPRHLVLGRDRARPVVRYWLRHGVLW